ncbi:MAG: GNAT family N-acetyltransferase [Candidatus Thorarchaeota archaeon]|nr:GNAT family N-acetyltransferase [Candidatus Thorarchaeota archaeon]
MASARSARPGQGKTRAYLVMKAHAKEALELARQWWEHKSVPTYVKVRQLRKDELAAFVELYNRCFIAAPDPFCPITLEDAMKLETEGIFVAEMWGTLVGFIACFVEYDKDPIYGEITGLGVLPSRRRKGVATALIQQAVEFFLEAGVEEVYCEVYEENWPSRTLIMGYGFKQVGRREIHMESLGESVAESEDLPGGKIMRRFGLRPRSGCKNCRDI